MKYTTYSFLLWAFDIYIKQEELEVTDGRRKLFRFINSGIYIDTYIREVCRTLHKMSIKSLMNYEPPKLKVKVVRRAVPSHVPITEVKQRVLEFCKTHTQGYKHVDIQDFSKSWQDGMAFLALIHSFYPKEFCYNRLDPRKRKANLIMAFEKIQQLLQVEPMIEIEEFLRPRPDARSVYTYVQAIHDKLLVTRAVRRASESGIDGEVVMVN